MQPTRRLLAIDGGGIKGVFPASFLATLERATGKRVVDYFDLIAGTSTGGIIALGLGLGFSAEEILSFYKSDGPKIFDTFGLFASLRQSRRSKYDPDALQQALSRIFQGKRLGESLTRLIIPAFDSNRGSVRVFKTAHQPRFEMDHAETAVDVAMATAAAPTYFPAHDMNRGATLVDGGVWANNPASLAAVESLAVLKWVPEDTRLLSIGCTVVPLEIPADLGYVRDNLSIIGLLMAGQSSNSIAMASLLLGDRPTSPPTFRIYPP